MVIEHPHIYTNTILLYDQTYCTIGIESKLAIFYTLVSHNCVFIHSLVLHGLVLHNSEAYYNPRLVFFFCILWLTHTKALLLPSSSHESSSASEASSEHSSLNKVCFKSILRPFLIKLAYVTRFSSISLQELA
ncbi:uncharacterized protein DS421_4g131690 [Arachis hypogaea]|nr:uncharacterized protein DS421_4g131690 [Arachis hypogaea]